MNVSSPVLDSLVDSVPVEVDRGTSIILELGLVIIVVSGVVVGSLVEAPDIEVCILVSVLLIVNPTLVVSWATLESPVEAIVEAGMLNTESLGSLLKLEPVPISPVFPSLVEVESTMADVLVSILDRVLMLSVVSVTALGSLVTMVLTEEKVLVSEESYSKVEVVLIVSVEEVTGEELDSSLLLGSEVVVCSELVEVP